jgi:predicted nuclease with TOPRIM domain
MSDLKHCSTCDEKYRCSVIERPDNKPYCTHYKNKKDEQIKQLKQERDKKDKHIDSIAKEIRCLRNQLEELVEKTTITDHKQTGENNE